jgi:lysophospholipase L1-like esterase
MKQNAFAGYRTWLLVPVAVALTLAAGGTATSAAAQAAPQAARHWVGTWATSPQAPADTWDQPATFGDQTLRQIVHISMGGDTLRVRFSNEFGKQPLVIGAASIALSAGGAAVVPGTSRPLTFGGEASITVPAGAPALSDPVALHVPPLADLAISLYLPDSTRATTYHAKALQTAYISPPGDHADAVTMPIAGTANHWFFLTGVSVRAPRDAGAIVAFGNSITDGNASTVDANARWPDDLARRLEHAHDIGRLAVLNEGISGNRLLHDSAGTGALARFDRDVLRQPGVRYVIVLLGINDIGFSAMQGFHNEDVSAEQIIVAHRQLIARAHQLGLTIYGSTLTPFEGAGYFTAAGEAKRQAVNRWIRNSGEYDGVIDFDRALREPDHPTRFAPAYDSGDHLHPGGAGYEAMARAVDLRLFAGTSAAGPRTGMRPRGHVRRKP